MKNAILSQSRPFSHLCSSTHVNKRAFIGRISNENCEMPFFNVQTGLTPYSSRWSVFTWQWLSYPHGVRMTTYFPQLRLFCAFCLISIMVGDIAEAAPNPYNECACTKEYRPVCGFNGRTYPTMCVAGCQGEQINYIKPSSISECYFSSGVRQFKCSGRCPCFAASNPAYDWIE